MTMSAEIEKLLDDYRLWLKNKTLLRDIDESWVEITTPYLDRHNDALQIYACRQNGGFVLTDACRAMMTTRLGNAPLALAAGIDVVNQSWELGVSEGQRLEAAHFGVLGATADMREGTAAFLAKRPPQFTGA